jgi:hypothetical protein
LKLLLALLTDFLSRTSNGLARCVDPESKPFSIKSDNPYDITFIEPAYVSTVEIEFSRPALGAGIELTIFDSLSNRNVRRRVAEDTFSATIEFSVKCVTTGISVLLQPTFLEMFGKRTLEIKGIRIIGYLVKDFEELTTSLTQLKNYRELAIAELSREQAELQSRYEKVQAREQTVEQLEKKKKRRITRLRKKLGGDGRGSRFGGR